MSWTVTVARSAARNLVKIPSKDREYIRAALLEMELHPFSGDITHLRDMSPAFRRRVGAYRILFDIFPGMNLVEVHDIRRRNEKTYRKNR